MMGKRITDFCVGAQRFHKTVYAASKGEVGWCVMFSCLVQTKVHIYTCLIVVRG